MTVRFAGSRSLDERRRRRLASGTDRSPETPETDAKPRIATERTSRLNSPGIRRGARLPVQAIVAPQLWKHALLGLSGLLVIGGILLCGLRASQWSHWSGPGVVTLFGLPEMRFARAFSAVLLLLAAQFAALIWWVRSRNARDFAGRYAIWGWAAATWFTMSAAVATDAHFALGQTVVWLWGIRIWNAETLGWLVPAIAIGEVLLTSLSRDMRECRSSVLFLLLTPIFYVASIILLFQPFAAENEVQLTLLQSGFGMCGHLSLLMSMLLHARYVVYESSEPPPVRPGRIKRWLQACRMPRIRWWRLRRKARVETSEAKEAATARSSESAAREADEKPKPRKKTMRTRTKASASPEADTTDSKSGDGTAREKDKAPKAPTRKAEPTSPPDDLVKNEEPPDESERRIDPGAEGPPNLKGLSKRERRAAQKRWREQQRAAQGL